ncbi:NUDIX hydrolase domain-like protein, partial [Phlyctochytrium arcticum]
FKCLRGWRNERYAVAGDALKGEGDLLHCERAAAGLLGIRAYGCHLNGYVRDPQTRQLKMWTARRSPTKQTYPSMLDNLVGGGLAAGVNPRENIIKECYEEAGMTADFVKSRLQDVGAVTFFLVDEDRGWVPTTEYTYDIELDSDFQPHAIDGEVANFMLLLPDEVLQHLRNGEFTPEAGLVTIDFLTRLGVVTAANEPDYLEILTRMHRSLSAPG